jgi:hypothetical protein
VEQFQIFVKISLQFACLLHANASINLVRQLLKTILEASIWRISLLKKRVFALRHKLVMLFNCLFVEVNSSKQFKAPVLTISLVIYVLLLSLGISLLHIPYIFGYIFNTNLTTLFVCTNMVVCFDFPSEDTLTPLTYLPHLGMDLGNLNCCKCTNKSSIWYL